MQITTIKIDTQCPSISESGLMKAAVAFNERVDLRISNRNESDVQGIANDLVYPDLINAYRLIGSKDIPAPEVLKQIVLSICLNIQWLVPEKNEISQAVNAAAMGKFDFNLELYGTVPSLKYWLQLLETYRAWKLPQEVRARLAYTDHLESLAAVTEAKKAKEKLNNSVSKFLQLADDNPTYFFSMKELPQYCRYGFGYDYLDNNGISDFIPEQKHQAMQKAKLQLARGNKLDLSLRQYMSSEEAIKTTAKDVLFLAYVNRRGM